MDPVFPIMSVSVYNSLPVVNCVNRGDSFKRVLICWKPHRFRTVRGSRHCRGRSNFWSTQLQSAGLSWALFSEPWPGFCLIAFCRLKLNKLHFSVWLQPNWDITSSFPFCQSCLEQVLWTYFTSQGQLATYAKYFLNKNLLFVSSIRRCRAHSWCLLMKTEKETVTS